MEPTADWNPMKPLYVFVLIASLIFLRSVLLYGIEDAINPFMILLLVIFTFIFFFMWIFRKEKWEWF